MGALVWKLFHQLRPIRVQTSRQAILRQSEYKSGKPELDEVANTNDELLKINSLIAKVALPGEVIEPGHFNSLARSLGKLTYIVFQGVLKSSPKLFAARRPMTWPRHPTHAAAMSAVLMPNIHEFVDPREASSYYQSETKRLRALKDTLDTETAFAKDVIHRERARLAFNDRT